MGDSSERNVLPLLPDAEECMELVSSGRLIGTALQRFHQGKLRLPTRRRARLLKLELKLTLLFVLLFLGIAWPAYPHGGGLLSQQPQARRLPLSPGAACWSVVSIKRRDVEAARDAELSDHAEAVIANQLTAHPSPS